MKELTWHHLNIEKILLGGALLVVAVGAAITIHQLTVLSQILSTLAGR